MNNERTEHNKKGHDRKTKPAGLIIRIDYGDGDYVFGVFEAIWDECVFTEDGLFFDLSGWIAGDDVLDEFDTLEDAKAFIRGTE